jgi:ProP effector
MNRESARKAIEILAERFPKCFFVYETRRQPLKVGIFADLLATGILSKEELHAALHHYCGNSVYRSRLIAGTPRVDLDGNAAGVVTFEQTPKTKPAKQPVPTITPPAEPVVSPVADNSAPRRLSLADLRLAAQQRKAGGNNATGS